MRQYRTALVTGASRGLGAALAHELLARDYRVMLVARHEDDLRRQLDGLDALQRQRADWLRCDLADPTSARALIGAAQQRVGDIDVLVNNAGASAYKPLVEWSPDEVITNLHLNLLAPMLLAQAVLPGMIERRRGMIVNIASDLARRPLANMAAYVAAKHGLLGFSASLLREVKAHGVKVCAVLPGIIDSAFNGGSQGSKDETWALNAAMLARRVVDLLELPENVVIDELAIHPLHQDF